MSIKTSFLPLIGVFLAAGLSACSGTAERAQTSIETASKSADAAQSVMATQKGHEGPQNVRYRDDLWLGSVGVKSGSGARLPAIFETSDGVVLSSAQPMGLVEIANRVSLITGIEVAGVSSIASARPGDGGVTDTGADPRNIQAVIDYAGPLSGLLDMVGARFNISWEYRGSQIRFFDVETRAFTLIVPPLDTEFASAVESTLNTGGGSSSDNQATTEQGTENGLKSTSRLSYWSRIETDIEALVPSGTPFSISPEAGSVVVSARPAVLERVATYIKDQNARMGRQVAISVRVLSIKTEDGDNMSASLNAAISGVGQDLAFNITDLAPGIATIATSALTGTSPISGGYAYNDEHTAFGASALVDALSRSSGASLVTSAGVTTMNGQPAPVQISKDITYISGYDNSLTDSATSITPKASSVKIGFSLNVLPRILPNNQVALNYVLGISELDQLRQIGEDFPIEAPEISSRGFQQNVMLNSGDTLVLAGFERTDSRNEDSIGLLSFGKKASQTRELIVILVTPVVIESPSEFAVMN